MVSDWSLRTIAQCASSEPYSTQIGPFGKALMAHEYTQSGVPVLRGVNVNNGRFFDYDFVFISEDKANQLSKYESYPGDVLLVHKGTLGKIGLMPSKRRYPRYILGNSMMRVRCDPAKLLPEYLFYWLSSSEGQHYLFSRISQVGVPQLQTPLTTLREAVLPVPPLPEQQAIVRVLGKMDDEIELEQQMNKSLEAIGQAIFRHWFVDFEFPNEEGKPYKSSGGETVDSELGAIPKGWRVGVFGDIAGKVSEPVSRSEKLRYDKYVSLDDMPRKQIFLVSYSSVSDVDSSMIGFEKGDVLFGAMRPYFHKVCIAPFTGITRTTTFVIRAKDIAYQSYLSFLCFEKSTVDYADSSSVGSTIPYAVYEALERMPVVMPERRIASEYQSFIKSFIEKAFCNSTEVTMLSRVRDTLLLKLMSGEIRVPVPKGNVEPD
jgi:type I restriction enzyme S subunit